MDTKYLTYILAIAERKNMTKAADELHVSQSSLSQYLSKLEQELGAALFIRAKGELVLTPAGKHYVEAAQKVLKIKKELYDDIRSLNNKSHITVGITSQFGLQMAAKLIPGYKKEFPDVTIEISETGVPLLTKLLLEGNIDCGIMALNAIAPFEPEQVQFVQKEEVYFAIPAGHPYRTINPHKVISQEELLFHFKDSDFIVGKQGSTLRFLSDKVFSNAGFKPHVLCETNSITTARFMVGDGVGVAFIAESCATDGSKVAYYSVKPQLFRYNALVCRKNWVMNQPETIFIRQIQDYFNKNNVI